MNAVNRPDVLARFFAKVNKSGDCWLWTGAMNSGGPVFWWNLRVGRARRFSYEAWVRPAGKASHMVTVCGEPRCVRPAHVLEVEPVYGDEPDFTNASLIRIPNTVLGTPCVLWPKVSGAGYGYIYRRGSSGRLARVFAHRASWEAMNGPIPGKLQVCHHCDTPPCVEPSHLFLGTSRDNHIDCLSKGRGNKAYGERASRAVLVEAEVLEILRGGESDCSFARRFGVSPQAVAEVRKRRTWKHLSI